MEKLNRLTPEYSREIEKKLDEGYLVELMKRREDGTIVARTVKKKEISLPTARESAGKHRER
jgi:hypothetical protein